MKPIVPRGMRVYQDAHEQDAPSEIKNVKKKKCTFRHDPPLFLSLFLSPLNFSPSRRVENVKNTW